MKSPLYYYRALFKALYVSVIINTVSFLTENYTILEKCAAQQQARLRQVDINTYCWIVTRKRTKNLGKSRGTLHILYASIFALKITKPGSLERFQSHVTRSRIGNGKRFAGKKGSSRPFHERGYMFLYERMLRHERWNTVRPSLAGNMELSRNTEYSIRYSFVSHASA